MVILSDEEARAIARALDTFANDGAVTPGRVEAFRRLLAAAPTEPDVG